MLFCVFDSTKQGEVVSGSLANNPRKHVVVKLLVLLIAFN